MNIKRFLSLGILDAKENKTAKQVGRYFDFIMLLVMFWLPLQWYAEANNMLSQSVINMMYWIVWSLFLLEAVVMTSLVYHKFDYLMGNWLNLFIIIIAFPPMWFATSTYLALLRYLRLIILLRLILPQLGNLHRILTRNRFGSTLAAFLTVTLLSGIVVAYLDPKMGSPWEGIWWALETVTTVGYGDVIPNTAIGRVFAAILMFVGVGLLSLVSANLAAYFIERGRRQEKKPERALQKEFYELHERLDKIEKYHQRLERCMSQLMESQGSKVLEERQDRQG